MLNYLLRARQWTGITRLTVHWMMRSVALWLGVAVTMLYSTGALLREDTRTGFAMVMGASEFFCIFFPVVACVGVLRLGRRDMRAKAVELVATRPVSAAVIVGADFAAIVVSVICAWLVVLAGGVVQLTFLGGRMSFIEVLSALPLGFIVGPLPVCSFMTLVLCLAALPLVEFAVLGIAIILWAIAALSFSLVGPLAAGATFYPVIGYGSYMPWLILNRVYGLAIGGLAFAATIILRKRYHNLLLHRKSLVCVAGLLCLIAAIIIVPRLARAPVKPADLQAANSKAITEAILAGDAHGLGPNWDVVAVQEGEKSLLLWVIPGYKDTGETYGRLLMQLTPYLTVLPGFPAIDHLIMTPVECNTPIIGSSLCIRQKNFANGQAILRYLSASVVRSWFLGITGADKSYDPHDWRPMGSGIPGNTGFTLLLEWALMTQLTSDPAVVEAEQAAWAKSERYAQSMDENARRQRAEANSYITACGAERSTVNLNEVRQALELWPKLSRLSLQDVFREGEAIWLSKINLQ